MKDKTSACAAEIIAQRMPRKFWFDRRALPEASDVLRNHPTTTVPSETYVKLLFLKTCGLQN